MNAIENDLQLTLAIQLGAFEAAVEHVMKNGRPSGRHASRARRVQMRLIALIILAAARKPASRPQAIEIYRAHRPKLATFERTLLRRWLGEDFDVHPTLESDILSVRNAPPIQVSEADIIETKSAYEEFDRLVSDLFDEAPTDPVILLQR